MKKSDRWVEDYFDINHRDLIQKYGLTVSWGGSVLAALLDKFAEEAVDEYKGRVAQLAEQSICNRQVVGSTPILASNIQDGLGPRA